MNIRGKIGEKEGVALVLALLFVVLLTVIVVEYTYETHVDAAFVQGYRNQLEAHVAARSAVAYGISLLASDVADVAQEGLGGGAEYDSLEDVWAFGVPYQPINDGVMQCRIEDEYGKLALNALLSPDGSDENTVLIEALRVLFELRGAEHDPVDAILDWIDPYDETRPDGAGNELYQSLEIPYSSKNAPMDSVEELLLIEGVTPQVYFGDPELEQRPLNELLTVRGHPQGWVNVNTAPYEVLEALGQALDGRLAVADVVMREREGQPFVDLDDIQSRGVYTPVEGEESTQRMLYTRSRVFKVIGDGVAGNTGVRAEALVWRGDEPGPGNLRILDWRLIR